MTKTLSSLLLFLLPLADAQLFEIGVITKTFSQNSTEVLHWTHSANQNENILLKLSCDHSAVGDAEFRYSWKLIKLNCPHLLYSDPNKSEREREKIFESPCVEGAEFLQTPDNDVFKCDGNHQVAIRDMSNTSAAAFPKCQQGGYRNVTKSNKVEKRMAKTWTTGLYLLELRIVRPTLDDRTPIHVKIEVKNKFNSFLSAINFPLLPFYAVLCATYSLLALIWLVLCICYRDGLLKLQLWIGAVILLGMVDSATYLGELDYLSSKGVSLQSTIIFGQIVSAMKRALARILVIIVSLGYGIVKPQLGPALQRVILLGVLYFVAASVEGIYRQVTPTLDTKSSILRFPLALIDAIAIFWIFSALVDTTRTLRVRRNIIKLSVYNHFINCLAFCVVSAFAFAIYTMYIRMWSNCPNWELLWLDEAFWPLLFTIILICIMFLWRPSANNQCYAYSPLLEGDDNDEDDVMYSMQDLKQRKARAAGGGGGSDDEDLRWVEENIPNVPESLLPSFADDEDERKQVEYEMSKMQ